MQDLCHRLRESLVLVDWQTKTWFRKRGIEEGDVREVGGEATGGVSIMLAGGGIGRAIEACDVRDLRVGKERVEDVGAEIAG